MLKRTFLGLSIALCCVANVQALEFKGTMSVNFPTNQPRLVPANHLKSAGVDSIESHKATTSFKPVVLMKVNLSPKEKRAFTSFDPRLEKNTNVKLEALPASAMVGMNNVPVLDQGNHGTCVTFATTAAIDSLLEKGDYVSQLCSLELGNYLEKYSEAPSGWDGSAGPLVLNQLLNYGIVPKDQEKQLACGGLTEYPLNNPDKIGEGMALENYHAARKQIDNFYWEPILSTIQRITSAYDHEYHPDAVLQSVKKALAIKPTFNRQVRVTFGVLLPVNHCFAGACAKYRQMNDTWALTDGINYDLMPMFGGHEMVITGYDDNAVVVDNEGKTHTGVLILRNSWGQDVGDQGNFYMTYDFFKKFATEVQKIVMFKLDDKQQ